MQTGQGDQTLDIDWAPRRAQKIKWRRHCKPPDLPMCLLHTCAERNT